MTSTKQMKKPRWYKTGLCQANTTDKHSKNERVKRDQRKTKKNGMRKMRDDMKMVHKRNRKVC